MQDLPNTKSVYDRSDHINGGIYNRILSNMAIETTFMRYGHSQGDIGGITLKPETLKTWAYSLLICHSIWNDLKAMKE